MEDHGQHLSSPNKKLLIGAGVTAAIVAAPHVLPYLGIGDQGMANSVSGWCAKSGTLGSGLAGFINRGVQSIPGVGGVLAQTGWTSTLVSGALGIGGALLGRYIEKNYDHKGGVPWGKIIRYASIATSMLIALPSILSGLSMGITYLGFLAGGATFAKSVYDVVAPSIGMMGGMSGVAAIAGMSGFLSHIVSCGAAALPAVGSLFVPSGNSGASHHKASTQTWANKVFTASAIPTEMIR